MTPKEIRQYWEKRVLDKDESDTLEHQICALLDVSASFRSKPTRKTNETEMYVDMYIKENGYPPTYQKIIDHFDLKSKSAAYARCRHFRYKMKRNMR